MEKRKCKSEECNNPKPSRGSYCNPCRNSKNRYGINSPQRESMLRDQGGMCLLCRSQIEFDGTKSQYSACIDHDHKTGNIRGILCGNCNTNIGYLENKKIDLDNLKQYLKS